MSLISVAVISKDDRPLYLKEFRGGNISVGGAGGGDGDFQGPPDDIFALAQEASSSSSSNNYVSEPTMQSSFLAGGQGIGQSCSLEQQFILHSALDRIQTLTEPGGLGASWRFGRPGNVGPDAMYVGLLSHVDDVRLYGYVTTTKIKIVVALEDSFLPGTEHGKAHEMALKNLMIKIHRLYTEYIANPFTNLSANSIKSSRFDNGVTANVNSFNRNPALTMR